MSKPFTLLTDDERDALEEASKQGVAEARERMAAMIEEANDMPRGDLGIDDGVPIPVKVHKNGSRMKKDWIYYTLMAMKVNQSKGFEDRATAYQFYSRGANWTSSKKWDRRLIIREVNEKDTGFMYRVWRIEDVPTSHMNYDKEKMESVLVSAETRKHLGPPLTESEKRVSDMVKAQLGIED